MLCFAIVLFTACNNKCWDEIHGERLPGHFDSECLVFITDNIGYLGGSIHDYGNNTQLARLYKTIDGGNSWSPIPVNQQGYIHHIECFGDTLVYSVYQRNKPSYVYRYTGVKTELIYQTHGNENIMAVHFVSPYNGYIISSEKSSAPDNLLKIAKGDLDTIASISKQYSAYHFTKDTLYSLTSFSTSNNYIATSLSTGKCDTTHFSPGIIVETTVDNNGNLLFAIERNNQSAICRVTNGIADEISLDEYAPYSISHLYANHNFIIAIANRTEDVNVIGVAKAALVSDDNGGTWHREELPNSLQVTPACLLNNDTFIAGGSLNNFQIRKPCAR